MKRMTAISPERLPPSPPPTTGPGCRICHKRVATYVTGTRTNPYNPNVENVSLVSTPSGCD